MEIERVLIENWPKTDYSSIIIAVIAVLVSLYSTYLIRLSFIKSHRPYVWAINYAVIGSAHNTIVHVPSKVMFRVNNAPAKIMQEEIKICLDTEQLFVFKDENIVRFPDSNSEWSFGVGKGDFDKIMSLSDEDKSKLVRTISLEYSSLDGGEIYSYKLEQSFDPAENQWKDTNAKAS